MLGIGRKLKGWPRRGSVPVSLLPWRRRNFFYERLFFSRFLEFSSFLLFIEKARVDARNDCYYEEDSWKDRSSGINCNEKFQLKPVQKVSKVCKIIFKSRSEFGITIQQPIMSHKTRKASVIRTEHNSSGRKCSSKSMPTR